MNVRTWLVLVLLAPSLLAPRSPRAAAPCEDFADATLVDVAAVNTGYSDNEPSISQDGLELYFVSDRPGAGSLDIWVAERGSLTASFGPPHALPEVEVGSINTPDVESGPEVVVGGTLLFFDRRSTASPSCGTPRQILVSERVGDAWGEPQVVMELLEDAYDGQPSLTEDGLEIFIESCRDGTDDIWHATRSSLDAPFGPLEAVDEINTGDVEHSPGISPDGLTLYFCRTPSNTSDTHVWMACRPNRQSPFSAAQRLESLDPGSGDHANTPDITADGRSLFFQDQRVGGSGSYDIWEASLPRVEADAGRDVTADEGDLVQLDGSGAGPEGELLAFAWTQLAGPPVELSSAGAAMPVFTAPFVTDASMLTFQLVVSAGDLVSEPDTVDVTVLDANRQPVADVSGSDQTVAEDTLVTLHGEASFDPDGDELGFQWLQAAGPEVVLSSPDAAKPTFVAPDVESPTTLSFELVVNDGELASEPATATVVVEPVNHAPVARTDGSTQTVGENKDVQLSGLASTDPDGDVLTYSWAQVAGPTVPLSDAASPTPLFVAPFVASTQEIAFELVVSDGELDSEPASAIVTVVNENDPAACSAAHPSLATLWPPRHGFVPITVEGVTDPDDDTVVITVTAVWQDEPVNGLGDGDTAPDAVLRDLGVLLRAERSGTGDGRVYHVSFVADDGTGETCSGSVAVAVPRSRNTPALDGGSLHDSTVP